MHRQRLAIAAPFEMIRTRQAGQRNSALGNFHFISRRNERTYNNVFPVLMTPQDGEGIIMASVADPLQLILQVALFHCRSLSEIVII